MTIGNRSKRRKRPDRPLQNVVNEASLLKKA
jgi:hypothetical protein